MEDASARDEMQRTFIDLLSMIPEDKLRAYAVRQLLEKHETLTKLIREEEQGLLAKVVADRLEATPVQKLPNEPSQGTSAKPLVPQMSTLDELRIQQFEEDMKRNEEWARKDCEKWKDYDKVPYQDKRGFTFYELKKVRNL